MTTITKTKSKTTSSRQTIKELPTNPFIFEILNFVSKQKTNLKKIEILKQYEDPSLKSLFIWNFDETVITLLPEGPVPYASVGEQNSFSGTVSDKINDAVSKMDEMKSVSLGANDQGRTTIRKEYKIFYNFVQGGNSSLSSLKRETMFINLLQGLHPLEAELLVLVKDKKLQSKYKITKEIISEAYPDIKWGGRS